MNLQAYLTPDPHIPSSIPSPTVIALTKPTRASRVFSLRDKGSSRGAIVINDFKTLFESKGEYWAALAYRAKPQVKDVIDQPPPIEYADDDGKIASHTFDYLVICHDGTRIAVVVKPSKLVEKNGVRRMIELLAEQTPRRFAQFIKLVTEKDLTADDRFNAEVIDAAMCKPDPKIDAIVAKLVGKLRGTISVGQLVAKTGHYGAGYRAIVRAIANGHLGLVEPCPIDNDAIVRRTLRNGK